MIAYNGTSYSTTGVSYAVSKLKEMRVPPMFINGRTYINDIMWADLKGELPFLSRTPLKHEIIEPKDSCSCSNPACNLPNGMNCRHPL